MSLVPPEQHPLQGMLLTDHFFDLPLDYSSSPSSKEDEASEAPFASATIKIFARHVIAAKHLAAKDSLPWLLYLQVSFSLLSPSSPTLSLSSSALSLSLMLLNSLCFFVCFFSLAIAGNHLHCVSVLNLEGRSWL